MDEAEVVRRLVAAGWKGSRDIAVGPGDDAAVLRGGLVVCTDMMVEDVHFRFSWISPLDAGFRAGAAALSDLAAMGARPVALLVSMALPDDPADGVEIQRGVRRAGDRVGVSIVGGDVSRSPGPVVIDVVALGRAGRRVVRRNGATPGQDLWVSGALGGSATAVQCWSAGVRPPPGAVSRFAAPPDRVPLGVELAAKGLAKSMIDVSDGLVADARRIADASGAKLVLRKEMVPVDKSTISEKYTTFQKPTISEKPTTFEKSTMRGDSCHAAAAEVPHPLGSPDLITALGGGEDYELLFTAESSAAVRIRTLGRELAVSLTRIGTVEPGSGVVLEEPDGRRNALPGGGHDHFSGGDP